MRRIIPTISSILCVLIFATFLFTPTISANYTANTWFAAVDGISTDCSQSNPGRLAYCVETKAQAGDTVYIKEGHYQSSCAVNNYLTIDKSLHLIGSCTWDAIGAVICYPQNEAPLVHSSEIDGQYSHRVIALQGEDSSVTIENLIIHQGDAHQKEPRPASNVHAGGGIYAHDIEQLTLKYNYIWANRAGDIGTGAQTARGGGLYASSIPNIHLDQNIFVFNTTSSDDTMVGYGGGIFITNSGAYGEVRITNNRFDGNEVRGDHDISKGGGACLYINEDLTLDKNTFVFQNSISDRWTDGSALMIQYANISSMDSNLFKYNYGASTIIAYDLTGKYTRNQFWDNDVSYDFYLTGYNQIEMINNFFGKWAPTSSSHLDEVDTPQGGISTSVYLVHGLSGDPRVNFIHNTFAHAEYAIQVDEHSQVDITHNIFTALTKTAIDDLDPTTTDIDVNENLFWANTNNGITGTFAWIADPKLVDPDNGDFHLQSNSAAIDKVTGGAIHTDIDNNPRPIGAAIDLGADEFGYMIYTPLVLR
jgi:hypothetical protein